MQWIKKQTDVLKTEQFNGRLIRQVPLILRAASVIVGFGLIYLFGIYGLTRTFDRLTDFNFFYVGGQVWLEGKNPYLKEDFLPHFAELTGDVPETPMLHYPPQAAPIFMLFGSLPYELSGNLYTLFNVLSLVGVGLLTARMINSSYVQRPATGLPENVWLMTALVLLLPTTWTAIHLGQVTPWIGAALIGSWVAYREKRLVLSGALFGVVTIKPQLAILPFIWYVCDRQWRVLIIATLTSVSFAIYPLVILGPITAVSTWIEALSTYDTGGGANTLGSLRILGVPSLLAAAGGPSVSPLVAEAVGGIFVFLFHRFRLHFSSDDYAGILLGLQVAVIYGRDHEILLLAPMAAAFWLYLRHKPAIWPAVAIVFFLIALPERVVGLLGIDILMHWRTATLLFCFVTLLWISFREHSAECQVKTG